MARRIATATFVVIRQRLESIEQRGTGAPAGEARLVDVTLEPGSIGVIAGLRRVAEIARDRVDGVEGAAPQIAFEKGTPRAAPSKLTHAKRVS